MRPADTTNVTIDGSRTTLVFGHRYSVRYGSDDSVLRDAILDRREPNGDLSFLVLPDETGANGGRRRVRPATIDSLVGSGTEYGPRRDESATAFLERAEDELGRWYSTWIGTDAGQAALEAVAAEDRSTRKANGRTGPTQTVVDGTVVATSRHVDARDRLPDEPGVPSHVSRVIGDGPFTDQFRSLEEGTGRLPRGICSVCGQDVAVRVNGTIREHRAAGSSTVCEGSGVSRLSTNATRPTRVAEILPKLTARGRTKLLEAGANPELVAHAETAEEVVPVATRSAGRPYAERNQVWRCGSCKRRTRAAFCENGHPRVEAPAGKRRDAR